MPASTPELQHGSALKLLAMLRDEACETRAELPQTQVSYVVALPHQLLVHRCEQRSIRDRLYREWQCCSRQHLDTRADRCIVPADAVVYTASIDLRADRRIVRADVVVGTEGCTVENR